MTCPFKRYNWSTLCTWLKTN